MAHHPRLPSSPRMKDSIYDQIKDILLLVKDALTRLHVDIGPETETGSHSVLTNAVHTIADQAAAKGLRGSFLKRALERDVLSVVLEPYVVDLFATRIIDCLAFLVRAAIFIKNQVLKYSFELTKMESRYENMIKVVQKTGS